MTDERYILSIDPGLESGIALIGYREGEAPWLEKTWQFGNGVSGLMQWTGKNWDNRSWDDYNDTPQSPGLFQFAVGTPGPLEVEVGERINPDWTEGDSYDDYYVVTPATLKAICEKFTARNTKGYSYTTASLEPLRGEGVLIALGLMPDYEVKEKRWRDPGQQYLVGGKDLADKKKRQHRFLDESGFRIDSKVLGYTRPDYNDARSAAAHGLKYLASVENHKPTFDLISNWVERNPV